MKPQKYWNDEMSFIAGALVDYLPGLPNNAWAQRDAIAYYVSHCMAAGFCTTEDHVRLCADRWLAGKRKVTPPGTKRRKRAEKERAKLRKSIPEALALAVKSVVTANEKAVTQYKAGNDKAINALVGQVMRQHKTDAALIKELLVEAMQ